MNIILQRISLTTNWLKKITQTTYSQQRKYHPILWKWKIQLIVYPTTPLCFHHFWRNSLERKNTYPNQQNDISNIICLNVHLKTKEQLVYGPTTTLSTIEKHKRIKTKNNEKQLFTRTLKFVNRKNRVNKKPTNESNNRLNLNQQLNSTIKN